MFRIVACDRSSDRSQSFSVGIVLVLLSVMLVAIPTPVEASSEVVVQFQPKCIASFMVDGVEYWFWAAAVTASPYGTGNMVIIIKNVSVGAYSFSVYVAPENLLLGEKYGWLVSLIGNGIIIPVTYTFEGIQSASVAIEETETDLTATVSGPISLNITYTPYGDSSAFIEDPGDRPYVDDHDGDGFWSNSTRRACTANGSFNGYQLGPASFSWGYFDIIDREWYRSIGQERTVGVSVGNLFTYRVTFNWSSTDPNMTMPYYYQSVGEMEWLSYSIVNVSGTNVTAQATMHLRNGTELIQTFITDVDTGKGNSTYSVVAANLDVNDTVYTSTMYSSTRINETTVRDYSEGARNTNHLNITAEINTTDTYQYISENIYWDKQTGFMVEMTLVLISETNVSRETISIIAAITQSNVWVATPAGPAVPGDLNGDGEVNIQDLAVAGAAFASTPSHPRWNPTADINKDNVIDMIDLVKIARYFTV